jgi:hypothetical protein
MIVLEEFQLSGFAIRIVIAKDDPRATLRFF